VNIGILASGGGSNALALIKAMQSGDINANPALVLSNNSNAGVLQKSRDLSVATEVVDHRPFKGDRAAFDAEIGQTLAKHQIDVVCLAGFMRIMTEGFVRTWEGKMLNIHPSLLPKYTGLNTHQRAIDAGDTKAGCTVHMVIPELDAGPILGQREVDILPDDTSETLAARVLKEEHILYPAMLAAYINKQ